MNDIVFGGIPTVIMSVSKFLMMSHPGLHPFRIFFRIIQHGLYPV